MKSKGLVYACLSSLGVGAMIPVGKVALESVSPPTLLFYMMLFGSVYLGVITGIQGKGGKSDRSPAFWKFEKYLFFQSLVSFVAVWLFWTGTRRLDPTVAAFLSRTELILTIFFAIVILKERLRPSDISALLLVLLGLILIKFPFSFDGHQEPEPVSGLGFCLILMSSLCFALCELIAKVAAPKYHPIDFAFRRSMLLTLFFGLSLLVIEREILVPPTKILFWIALAAVCGPVMGRSFYMAALRHLKLSSAAIVLQTQPIFVAIFAFLLLGQIPGLWQWIGGIVIIGGCLISVSKRKDAEETVGLEIHHQDP